jgi:hypothetical protein
LQRFATAREASMTGETKDPPAALAARALEVFMELLDSHGSN